MRFFAVHTKIECIQGQGTGAEKNQLIKSHQIQRDEKFARDQTFHFVLV